MEMLIRIEMGLAKAGSYDLEQIRDAYYIQTGKKGAEATVTFDLAYSSFVAGSAGQWTDGTKKHFDTLQLYKWLPCFELFGIMYTLVPYLINQW
jgi:hypothetical protein